MICYIIYNIQTYYIELLVRAEEVILGHDRVIRRVSYEIADVGHRRYQNDGSPATCVVRAKSHASGGVGWRVTIVTTIVIVAISVTTIIIVTGIIML